MYLAESFRIADQLMADGEDIVQKGVGWLLKEQGAHHPDEVVGYLKDWSLRTSRLVLRYAAEKLAAERRVEVLSHRAELWESFGVSTSVFKPGDPAFVATLLVA